MLAKFFVFKDYIITENFRLSIRIDRSPLSCLHQDSRHPKCECNKAMRPMTKFVFKLIYNGNIFPAFRKVIPSLSYSEIKAIKTLGIKFRKHYSAT